MAQNFKLKVLTLITKLSDRDTYKLAATELDSVAGALDNTTLPTFISCILSTDSTDKPLVRKQCLHLLSKLSLLHSNSLSPCLPKIISYIVRRLRDLDSSIRSQCVTTVSTLASKITKQPFSTAFLKPLSESVFTEQDANAQVGSALCLAAAIDSAPNPEPGRLGKMLVPKLERLLKSDSYKSKSAGLVVMGSVIGVGGVRGYGGLGGLVKSLVGFLSSEDWAARKAAAEALGRLAVVESDAMAEFKSGSLKVFESRKFDKVKATREVMHQMIEAWKQIPDISEEASPPSGSQASSKEVASDERCPPSSKHYGAVGYETPQMRKKTGLASMNTPPDNSAITMSRRSSLKSNEKKTGPSMFRKIDCKKPLDWKVEIPTSNSSSTVASGKDSAPGRRLSKLEPRSLFGKSSDEKAHRFSGCKSGSRVVPCHEETPVSLSPVVASSVTENQHNNHKECEDLSLIRNQLVQIERQQSCLLDLLQRFMGSSQNGMHSLETRVQGLELALDEISYDLAVSSGRMADSKRTTCCMLPGADFLSPKFWRKAGHCSNSRFSTSGTPPLTAIRRRAERNGQLDSLKLESRRLLLQGGSGLIVNPLAEIHDSRGMSVAAQ
ncbi:TORTIFOLIA1-like protein 3 [Euphorbia lathyris]|uniref:TORTIFOLIA1-like protein 3 n=1 Tax=Euphorbia lathyris TaxID=212925 RepID=UPI0033131B5C